MRTSTHKVCGTSLPEAVVFRHRIEGDCLGQSLVSISNWIAAGCFLLSDIRDESRLRIILRASQNSSSGRDQALRRSRTANVWRSCTPWASSMR